MTNPNRTNEAAVLELEADLYDTVVLAERTGTAVDVETLVARLPEGRRADFRTLLLASSRLRNVAAAVQAGAASDRTPVAEAAVVTGG